MAAKATKMSAAQKAKAAKIYTCMRSVENWAKISPKQKFDKATFDPKATETSMTTASPKMEQLFKIIQDQDAADFQQHGKYFKHFIFSDVKEQGYGAKILASAFMARGYTNLINAKKVPNQQALKLVLNNNNNNNNNNKKNKNFAVLSSSAVFDAEYTQKFKKEVLDMYNKRPENVHGALMRFIILDSGFKEGIDLFDVKYVHIFEPSMTIADLKQTIGRATRTCGQKALPFQPGVGWPLYVYNYFLTVPEEMQAIYQVADKSLLRDPQSEYIFKDTQKFKDAILLYSQMDKALLNLAEQLYALGPTLSVDYGLTTNIHQVEDAAYLYDDGSQAHRPLLALALKNKTPFLALKNKTPFLALKNKTPLLALKNSPSNRGGTRKNKSINCAGKCGAKANKEIPATIPFMFFVYKKYQHDLKQLPPRKNLLRPFFCAYLKSNAAFCEQVNAEWQKEQEMTPEPQPQTEPEPEPQPSNSRNLTYVKPVRSPSRTVTLKKKSTPLKHVTPLKLVSPVQEVKYEILLYKGTNSSTAKATKSPSTATKSPSTATKSPSTATKSPSTATKSDAANPPAHKLNFVQMRDYIKTHFGGKAFTWEPIKLVNKCIEQPPSAKTNNIMTFNPTQNFVRHYFVPTSPYKGLLLWHSVGTGKTCTAIATATSSFEREGYTILWVTRTTLKSDIWKNMFGQICHTVIAEEINKGLLLPEDESKRKRLLSKSWVEPMSYKQFSNLLSAQNAYYTDLVARNGKADVIRKTLIIIDEAHKLYGGDLKSAEKPDMAIMEKLLQNSYKVSGANSAKLLLMTATPFTNSPLELFQLINLCKEEQFIPTEPTSFKERYMNAQNILSPEGVKRLANELTGYISYLNRERDPTQFAQPIMIDVPVMMSHLTDPQLRTELLRQKGDKTAQKAAEKAAQQKAAEVVKQMEATLKQQKTTLKTFKKTRKVQRQEYVKQCKTTYKKDKVQQANCLQALERHAEKNDAKAEANIQAEIARLQHAIKDLKADKKTARGTLKKQLKEKMAALKDSSLQEVALVQRCKSLKA